MMSKDNKKGVWMEVCQLFQKKVSCVTGEVNFEEFYEEIEGRFELEKTIDSERKAYALMLAMQENDLEDHGMTIDIHKAKKVLRYVENELKLLEGDSKST